MSIFTLIRLSSLLLCYPLCTFRMRLQKEFICRVNDIVTIDIDIF